jgi:5'-nucleotidase (lipoprotein e(P4) family)
VSSKLESMTCRNLSMKPIRIACLGLVLALTVGCASREVRESTATRDPLPPSAASSIAHDNVNAVVWMQTAVEYAATTRTVYAAAALQLNAALADPRWDALPPSERGGQRVEGLPPAIIVDADETVIDNSPYQARLVERGAMYDPASWSEWVETRSATAVPGALDFLRGAARRGITVFYVTNRSAQNKRATVDNLRALGFPLSEPEDTVLTVDESQGWTSAKGTRRQFVGERYRVLMMFGDNLGDFVDGYNVSVDERAALVEPYGQWWGTRWFMLPNPSYGSWEAAVTRGADDAHAAKRRILRSRY